MRRLALLALLFACDSGPSFSATKTITGSIALQGATSLKLGSQLSVKVLGHSGADIEFSLPLTATASTASKAQSLVDLYKIEVDRTTSPVLQVTAPNAGDGTIEGQLEIKVPNTMAIDVGTNGAILIGDMKGKIVAKAFSGCAISDAEGDVDVTSGSGAQVQTRATPGTHVRVVTERGDAIIYLPPNTSADVGLSVPADREVVIEHPAFEQPFGPRKQNYVAKVNGGLAEVRVLNKSGTVALRAH